MGDRRLHSCDHLPGCEIHAAKDARLVVQLDPVSVAIQSHALPRPIATSDARGE
jgi:hypothetical protein